MGLLDIAPRVLQEVTESSVQHAHRPGHQGGGVVAARQAVPGGLHPHEAHRLVVDKGMEQAHGVAAAADAGHQALGQAAGDSAQLGLGLFADDRLEVPDDHGVRMRPAHRAQDIMGMAHVGDPIPDGFVHGVFQGAAAGTHRDHAGAQQAHADDVEPLAPDVFGAHVDVALHPQQGRHRGGGHAMLAGPGLGDEPLFAHAPGQQALAQGVVDLVGPGVGQVFPLDVNLRAPQGRGQMPGKIEGRGPAHIILEIPGQLVFEFLFPADLTIGRFQLQQGRHQGLRHKPTPIPPIPAMFDQVTKCSSLW